MKNWDCTCEGGYRGEVYHCPMHLAAGAMYEALKLYQKHQEGTSGHYCWKCEKAITEAIQKAEAKDV